MGEELDTEEIRLVRAGDTPLLMTSIEDGAHVFHKLSGNFDGQFHSTFIVDIPTNKPHISEAFHGGRELLHVLEGNIEMSIGKKCLKLAKGDYLEFPGNIRHTIVSPKAPSRILLVIVDSNGTTSATLST